MKTLSGQRGRTCATALLALIVAGCGGGSSDREYTLAGRVVNGNPYGSTTEPRPGTTILVSRSAGTYDLQNGGGTDERYEAYTETVADAEGSFSLRVPAGLYYVRTIPPLGVDPDDGIETSDDVCSSYEVLRFPPRPDTPQGEGRELILGHDFCGMLPRP